MNIKLTKTISLCIYTILLFAIPTLNAVEEPAAKPDPDYYSDLARIHQRYGFYSKAIEMYQKALDLEQRPQGKSKLLRNIAQAYLNAGKPRKAKEAINRAIKSESEPDARIHQYFILARVYEELKQPERALEAYEFILKNCKRAVDSETAHDRLSDLLTNNGFLDSYIQTLEKRLEDEPENTVAMECLAHAYLHKEGSSKKAISLLEKLRNRKKQDRNIANELVRLYKQIGEYEKAVNVYIELMSSVPDEPRKPYYLRISDLYLDARKPEEALKWDLKMLEEDPDNPLSIFRVAGRHQQLGNNDRAEEYFNSAIEKARKNSDKEFLTLELIDFYVDVSRLEEARNLAKKLLDKTTDNVIRKETETRLVIIDEKLKRITEEQDQN